MKLEFCMACGRKITQEEMRHHVINVAPFTRTWTGRHEGYVCGECWANTRRAWSVLLRERIAGNEAEVGVQ